MSSSDQFSRSVTGEERVWTSSAKSGRDGLSAFLIISNDILIYHLNHCSYIYCLVCNRNWPALDHEFIHGLGAARGRGEAVPTIYQLHCLGQKDHAADHKECSSSHCESRSNSLRVWGFLRPALPVGLNTPQMVCVPGSISHTSQLHSSTHHWQWSTSWNAEPVCTITEFWTCCIQLL